MRQVEKNKQTNNNNNNNNSTKIDMQDRLANMKQGECNTAIFLRECFIKVLKVLKGYYILVIVPEMYMMSKQKRTNHFPILNQLHAWRQAAQSAQSSHDLTEAWLSKTSSHMSGVTSENGQSRLT